MQMMLLALAVQGTWGMMPQDLKQYFSEGVMITIASTLLVAGIIGRMVSQTPPSEPKSD